jgi:hypothetical protein
VGNDRLIRRLQNVDAVRRDLAEFLVRLGVAIGAAIAGLRRGVPASDHVAEATSMHVELVQKLDDMHSAVHQARAEGVRVLVEDEGLPVSTVARLMGRPRQLVARLYQHARDGQARNGHARKGQALGNGLGDGSTRTSRNGSSTSGARTPESPTGAAARTKLPPAAQ